MTSRTHPTRFAAAVAAAALLALSACSSSDGGSTASTTGSTPGSTAPGTTDGATTGTDGPGTTVAAKDPADVTLDPDTQAQLDEVFASAFEETGLPGATARITIGDTTWEQTLGVDDLETKAPFDPEANFRIASITKTFTGNAVLQLADEGKLSLDDTLESYVPGIANGDRITVRNLLAMDSGIWDFTADDELVARFDADPTFAWTPQETVELIKTHPAEFEPGAKVMYCDSNYVLLGLIIEQVTGMTAAEAINTMVVAELGLTNTDFPDPGEVDLADPATTGYLTPPEGSTAEPTVVGGINPQFAWTAGAMTSNLDDLQAWARELGEGSLLAPETQAARLQGEAFDGQKIDLGYGLGITTLNDMVGHNGAIIGYSSFIFAFPEHDMTIVVLGNESNNFTTDATTIGFSLIRALYPDQLR
jgi:D-alanyl-D-alanine carboxypeptidase